MLRKLLPATGFSSRCSPVLLEAPRSSQYPLSERLRWYSGKQRTHYTVLELNERASAKDIKSAFYRLSMKYHPDRNARKPEAAEIFRDISEAYQVLSNPATRKEYDAKILGIVHTDNQPLRTHGKVNVRGPPPTGRSHIYNFDEFYRQHYGRKVAQDSENKKLYEEWEAKREADNSENVRSSAFATATLIAIFVAVYFASSREKGNDRK